MGEWLIPVVCTAIGALAGISATLRFTADHSKWTPRGPADFPPPPGDRPPVVWRELLPDGRLRCVYSTEGDTLHLNLETEPGTRCYYGRWVGDHLTLLLDQQTDDLLGLEITGVRRLMDEGKRQAEEAALRVRGMTLEKFRDAVKSDYQVFSERGFYADQREETDKST